VEDNQGMRIAVSHDIIGLTLIRSQLRGPPGESLAGHYCPLRVRLMKHVDQVLIEAVLLSITSGLLREIGDREHVPALDLEMSASGT